MLDDSSLSGPGISEFDPRSAPIIVIKLRKGCGIGPATPILPLRGPSSSLAPRKLDNSSSISEWGELLQIEAEVRAPLRTL